MDLITIYLISSGRGLLKSFNGFKFILLYRVYCRCSTERHGWTVRKTIISVLIFFFLIFSEFLLRCYWEESLINNGWMFSVVMDRRLISLQDKAAGDDKSCQHTSQSLRKLNNFIRILWLRSTYFVKLFHDPLSLGRIKFQVSSRNMESLIKSLNKTQRHARGQQHHETQIVNNIKHKVDQIYTHLTRNGQLQQDSPRFDYLRSHPSPSGHNGILTIGKRSISPELKAPITLEGDRHI